MKFKGYVAALPALLLVRHALDSPPIMTASVTSQASPATAKPTVSVTGILVNPERPLSQPGWYSSPADTLQKLTGVVSGEDPDQVRKNAVRVRVFRVESENSHKGACLPVRYDDNGAQRKMDSLTNGRRMVFSEDEGQSGQQIYNKVVVLGFSYRLL